MTREADGRFGAGNSGKPRGTRHRTTTAVEELLDGEAEGLTRKAVEMALSGDTVAMRLCLDRIAPVRRDRPVTFDIPRLNTVDDIASAGRSLMLRVSEGEISPAEAGDVMKLLEGLAKTIEVAELERRLRVLEEGAPR